MTISEFISDRLGKIISQIFCMTVAAAFLLATGTSSGVLKILLIFFLLIFLISQTSDYLKCNRRLSELHRIMEELDQKYLLTECAPPSDSIYERKLFELLRISGRSMIGAVSDAQTANREYRDYIESWVHEIKTPITAAMLLGRHMNRDIRNTLSQTATFSSDDMAVKTTETLDAFSEKLSAELTRIEMHVQRALYYARVESPEKDCIIRQINLADAVSDAIRNHKSLLIQNNMKIETENLDFTVYTDAKWTAFILGQLLQNAVRYRNTSVCPSETPLIRLSACSLGQQVRLTVSDNGIGIPAHELPRIFDRGFTGSNGRLRGGSTGMGLYLCRKLVESLEIDLHISSEEQKGTAAVLTFPAKSVQSSLQPY